VLDVERWAELRREHFVRGVSIKELARRHGIDRNTVRRARRSDRPPRYERERRPSKLDPFKEEICELLRADPKLPGVRIRELIAPLGFAGSKTIVDDYLREALPLFLSEAHLPAHDLSSWRGLPVGSVGALKARACRPRADPTRVCGGRVPRLFPRRRRRADLQQGAARRAVGYDARPVVAGRVPGADGVGPRGLPRRRWLRRYVLDPATEKAGVLWVTGSGGARNAGFRGGALPDNHPCRARGRLEAGRRGSPPSHRRHSPVSPGGARRAPVVSRQRGTRRRSPGSRVCESRSTRVLRTLCVARSRCLTAFNAHMS
jgi:transposase-like protein